MENIITMAIYFSTTTTTTTTIQLNVCERASHKQLMGFTYPQQEWLMPQSHQQFCLILNLEIAQDYVKK